MSQKLKLADKLIKLLIKSSKRVQKAISTAYEIGFKAGYGEGAKLSVTGKNPRLKKKINREIRKSIYNKDNLK